MQWAAGNGQRATGSKKAGFDIDLMVLSTAF
jgi:hypothetical protein